LPLIQRDYKFSNYKLKTVSEEILKDDNKKDLSIPTMFKLFKIGIQKDENGQYNKKSKKAMSIIASYCIKDSELVIKLIEKMRTWISLCEMSNVVNTSIFALYTQGQQIKIFSQVYKFCFKKNIIVQKDGYIAGENDRYMGAHVFPPVPGIYDRVLPFDFCSLYPSTIIAYNIDYFTYVTDDKIPDSMCNVMSWSEHQICDHDPKIIKKNELTAQIEEKRQELKKLREERDKKINKSNRDFYVKKIELLNAEIKPLNEERSELVKSMGNYKMCTTRKFRFLKEPKGVIPTILQNTLDARKQTRNQIKQIKEQLPSLNDDKDKYNDMLLLTTVLDKRQLAYKVNSNSMYGAFGVKKGYLPFMAGAQCVTYLGRKNIEIVSKIIPEKYGGELVYGDSVTADTPVLIRYPDKTIDIKTIETLSEIWFPYEQFKAGDSNRKEKQQSIVNLEVWTNNKWSNIRRVIRHKTNKKIFRINTHIGCIDVSEDHSLLNEKCEIMKPTEIKIGDKLLHSFPKEFNDKITEKEYKYNKITCIKCNIRKYSYEFYDNYKIKKCKECIWIENSKNRKNVRGITKSYFSEAEYLQNSGKNLTIEEAFVWGFFMGDGSCGQYPQKNTNGYKYSWALNNSNLEYLNRAKQYIEKCEPHFEFKILDTMKSSGVYKLVCVGKVRLLVKKYRPLFYDKDDYKIVPYVILNSNIEIKKAFFEGYYMADGCKSEKDTIIPKNKCITFCCKGKIGSQGLYYILKSIGYDNVSIRIYEKKNNIYWISTCKKFAKNSIEIKKIIELPSINNNEFIYDLETDDGIFHAGIGEIVVKNTD
jgi:hypothetical protein